MPENTNQPPTLESSTPQWQTDRILRSHCPQPIFNTEHGVLFQGDCLEILKHLKSESVDTVFADPPFNLGKHYGKKVNDILGDREYLNWMFAWIAECERVLRPGGSLFIYNLPRWNITGV